jgi:tRNA (mo5U34)-methyltransferase
MLIPPSYLDHPDWPAVEARIDTRVSGHGDTPRWQAAVASIPSLEPESVEFGDRITVRGSTTDREFEQLTTALRGLHPWRKGPFDLYGVHVDTEWRSDWKWNRVAPALGALAGARVLDVGCGNGYFGWRALAAGAEEVVGVDPSVLFWMQHDAVCRCLGSTGPWQNHLIPLPFEALPVVGFDLVLSMGVVYHRRDPAEHVNRLFEFTVPGGRVLLESLIVRDGPALHPAATGEGRYARMRNVSVVPRVSDMERWLLEAGFENPQVVDVTTTTTDEQRTTEWMTFESLAQALDPTDPGRTVEGHPAPVRAAVLAHRPGPALN